MDCGKQTTMARRGMLSALATPRSPATNGQLQRVVLPEADYPVHDVDVFFMQRFPSNSLQTSIPKPPNSIKTTPIE